GLGRARRQGAEPEVEERPVVGRPGIGEVAGDDREDRAARLTPQRVGRGEAVVVVVEQPDRRAGVDCDELVEVGRLYVPVHHPAVSRGERRAADGLERDRDLVEVGRLRGRVMDWDVEPAYFNEFVTVNT